MSILGRIWKYAKWPVIVLALLYVALVIYEIPAVRQKDKSDAAVARIHAQKLTMADVDGKHLPPPPDPNLVDATVQGVDANGNGIRDDVELAIFKKYPDDIKLRAAELQYAIGVQNGLTAISAEAFIASEEQKGRGYACLYKTLQGQDKVFDQKEAEITQLVANTTLRARTLGANYTSYMASFGVPRGNSCDLNF